MPKLHLKALWLPIHTVYCQLYSPHCNSLHNKGQVEVEVNENNAKKRQLRGNSLRYGESIQLQHTLTGKYICVSSTETSFMEHSKLRVSRNVILIEHFNMLWMRCVCMYVRVKCNGYLRLHFKLERNEPLFPCIWYSQSEATLPWCRYFFKERTVWAAYSVSTHMSSKWKL